MNPARLNEICNAIVAFRIYISQLDAIILATYPSFKAAMDITDNILSLCRNYEDGRVSPKAFEDYMEILWNDLESWGVLNKIELNGMVTEE